MLVDTCRDVLDMTAAAILLADGRGELEVIASTSESSRLVEMMQLSAEAGPCIESFRTGRAGVPSRDRGVRPTHGPHSGRAPSSRASAPSRPFRCGCATSTIGTLNLLRSERGSPAGGRPQRRPGVRGRRDHRHPARTIDPRERRAHGAAAGGAEQPDRHRAGEGRRLAHARRADRRGVHADPRVRPVAPPRAESGGSTPRRPQPRRSEPRGRTAVPGSSGRGGSSSPATGSRRA